MPRKTIYRSALIPGVQFNSYEEAMAAENEITRRQRESSAFEALGSASEMMTKPQQEPVLPTYQKPEFNQSAGMPDIKLPISANRHTEALGEKYLPQQEMKPYKAPLSPREAMIKSGAYQHLDNPAVKEFSNAFVRDFKEEDKAIGNTDKSLFGWKQRSNDWNTISALPDGPEKDAAIESYLYKWAPSVGYNASPESVEQSKRRAVSVAEATIPAKVETAAKTTTARVEAEAGATKRLPDKDRQMIIEDFNNIKNLERVAGKFDPKYVGPIKGRYGDFKEFLGVIGVDEKVFRAEVQNYVDRLIKSTTGAQMSEPEAQRIMRETVNFNVNPEAYLATLDSNIETIRMRLKGAVDGLKTTNYDVSEMEKLISPKAKNDFDELWGE